MATTSTSIVTTRATRKSAQTFINRYTDGLGTIEHWDGQRFVPATLTWEAVKNADGRWDVVSTFTR